MPVPEPRFDDLYREVILDHAKRPRHRGRLDAPTHTAAGMNPTCGDEVEIDLDLRDGRVADACFVGQGCSISLASASMLMEQIAERTPDEIRSILAEFSAMLLEGRAPGPDAGDLVALEGVAQFPQRVKCALLSSNVLEQALDSTTSSKT